MAKNENPRILVLRGPESAHFSLTFDLTLSPGTHSLGWDLESRVLTITWSGERKKDRIVIAA